jgi:aminoglycoside 6'-N-acetyltransferase
MEDTGFDHLRTDRLLIRRFRPEDGPALSAYRSDPDVARLQSWEVPFSRRQAAELIDQMVGVSPGAPGKWFQFALVMGTGEPLIGDIALHASADGRQAEVGFTVARAWQGRGYATEALRGVVDYAFSTLALHRIFAMTDERNGRSKMLLRRLGFREEGCLVEGAWYKGEWVNECIYAQLAAEWKDR